MRKYLTETLKNKLKYMKNLKKNQKSEKTSNPCDPCKSDPLFCEEQQGNKQAQLGVPHSRIQVELD